MNYLIMWRLCLQRLLDELMKKLDSELKHEVCHWAAFYVSSFSLLISYLTVSTFPLSCLLKAVQEVELLVVHNIDVSKTCVRAGTSDATGSEGHFPPGRYFPLP